MAKTEVAAATQNLPTTSLNDEFSSYAGDGLENVTVNDVLIPRLAIIQGLSPQLKARDAAYIPGAKIGDIADVGTGDLYPDGVVFLPVYYVKQWLEWAPRASGKGLVMIHTMPDILEQTVRDDKNRPILPNGNYIAETAQFFGMNMTDGRRKCFIPMASSQLKKARKWMLLTTGEKLQRADKTEFTPPIWYRTYKLTTADESNNEGDWQGWVINRGLALPELTEVDWRSVKAEAISFREALVKGEAKADVASMGAAGEDGPTTVNADGEVIERAM